MKLYGGIDLHSNNSFFSIKDETGDALSRRKLPNDLSYIFKFVTPFKEQLSGVNIRPEKYFYTSVRSVWQRFFVCPAKLANPTD